jgi:hypothetical protein
MGLLMIREFKNEKAPKGNKIPWSLRIGTFQKLFLMTSSRRLDVLVMG